MAGDKTQVDDGFRLDANDSAGTQHVGDDGEMQFEEYEQPGSHPSKSKSKSKGKGKSRNVSLCLQWIWSMNMNRNLSLKTNLYQNMNMNMNMSMSTTMYTNTSPHNEGKSGVSSPTSNTFGSGSDSRSEMMTS